MPFAGKRVLSLESRRAVETAELIRRNGGDPFVAPSMKEVPLENNTEALRFAERLLASEFEMVIFMTGVGTRYLMKVVTSRYSQDEIVAALNAVTVVARGPKPTAVLRELGVPIQVIIPEPNTWREIVQAIEGRPERRIALQEYGRPSTELIDVLRSRGSEVTAVPVYQWALPDDLEPLREAVIRLAQASFEVTLFTTGQQTFHLMQVARELNLEEPARQGIRKSCIASIGPTCTEALREHGFEPDLEPSHPKLGILVKEAAEKCGDLLWTKKI